MVYKIYSISILHMILGKNNYEVRKFNLENSIIRSVDS